MDIYLSVNNRAEVLRLPVLPPEFTVAKGKNNEVFDTVSQGQLMFSLTGEKVNAGYACVPMVFALIFFSFYRKHK